MEHQSECCPPFDPALWDDKMITWENKAFVRDRIMTFFHMPLNFGRVMRRIDKKVREAGATMPDNMGLSDHTSKWNIDIYVAVDREIPGAENVALSGKFFTRVYEGPFQNTGKWCKDFESLAKSKDHEIKKQYMWYTTCPRCAKKYGKNYVVLLGEVK